MNIERRNRRRSNIQRSQQRLSRNVLKNQFFQLFISTRFLVI